MSDAIQTIGGALALDLKRAELISQNISNAGTPGYQSQSIAAADFARYLRSGAVQIGAPISHAAQGMLVATGNPSKLALNGPGYFALQDEKTGRVQLVRHVSMAVNENGYLTAGDGRLLLGTAGPVTLTALPEVTGNGEVLVAGKLVSKLRVVHPADAERAGDALLTSTDWRDAEATVMQGMTEKSNVNVNSQLIELMRISKHVESNQRALSTLDGMIGGGINELGKR